MVITLYFCTIQRHPQRPSLSSPPSANAWDHHPFQKLTCPQLPTACQGYWPGCCSAMVLHLPTHPSTPGLGDAQPLLASDEGWSNKIPDSKSNSLAAAKPRSAGWARFCRTPNQRVWFRGPKLPGGVRGRGQEAAQPHAAPQGPV